MRKSNPNPNRGGKKYGNIKSNPNPNYRGGKEIKEK
jgi:hypothetical protein